LVTITVAYFVLGSFGTYKQIDHGVVWVLLLQQINIINFYSTASTRLINTF